MDIIRGYIVIGSAIHGAIASQVVTTAPSAVGFFKRNVGVTESSGELVSWEDLDTNTFIYPTTGTVAGGTVNPMLVDGNGSPYIPVDYIAGLDASFIWDENMRCAISYTNSPGNVDGSLFLGYTDSAYGGRFAKDASRDTDGSSVIVFEQTVGDSSTNYGTASGKTAGELYSVISVNNFTRLVGVSGNHSVMQLFLGTLNFTTWAVSVHAILFYTDSADDDLAKKLVLNYVP